MQSVRYNRAMKILFSPAKTLHLSIDHDNALSQPLFQDEAIKLFLYLKHFSKAKIQKTFHLSDKLADEVFALYHNFEKNNTTYPALKLYNGLAFRQLHSDTYTHKQLDYASKHLRICSAMYGLLSPMDGIWPYRLDFTISLAKFNLKKQWTPKINEVLKEEDLILNLASEEFSSLISHPNMHTVYFFDEKDGIRKVNSAEAKKARGQCLEWCILNQFKDISELKKFELKDYTFDSQDNLQTTFIRQLKR